MSIIYINPYQYAAAPVGGTWTPAEISTTAWYDANDATTLYDATTGGSLVAADGLIARWEDKSGNARHLTQSNSALRPTYKANVQNGKNIVRFDGSDYINSPGDINWSGNLFYASLKTTTADTLFSLFGNPLRTAFYYLAQSGSATALANNGARIDGAPATWTTRGGYWNAVARDQSFIAMLPILYFSSGPSDLLVLPYSGFNLPMDYNEIVIPPNTISLADQERIEGYLAHKWDTAALLPAGHPYKTVAP